MSDGRKNTPRQRSAAIFIPTHIRKEFEQLAHEGKKMKPAQRLCATCDYSNPPTILDEEGKPQQRLACVIRAPKNGLWMLSSGPSLNFQERFRILAIHGGRALGVKRNEDPAGVWLDRLYFYLEEHHGGFLGPKLGGRYSALRNMNTILDVCEASTMFCSFLERQALEVPPTSQIGQNINKFRNECGWTYDQLAANTNLDKKLILSHVNKGTKPTASTKRVYADVFSKGLGRRVSVEELER